MKIQPLTFLNNSAIAVYNIKKGYKWVATTPPEGITWSKQSNLGSALEEQFLQKVLADVMATGKDIAEAMTEVGNWEQGYGELDGKAYVIMGPPDADQPYYYVYKRNVVNLLIGAGIGTGVGALGGKMLSKKSTASIFIGATVGLLTGLGIAQFMSMRSVKSYE